MKWSLDPKETGTLEHGVGSSATRDSARVEPALAGHQTLSFWVHGPCVATIAPRVCVVLHRTLVNSGASNHWCSVQRLAERFQRGKSNVRLVGCLVSDRTLQKGSPMTISNISLTL